MKIITSFLMAGFLTLNAEASLVHASNCIVVDARYSYPNRVKPSIGSKIRLDSDEIPNQIELSFHDKQQNLKYLLEGKMVKTSDSTFSFSQASGHVSECGDNFLTKSSKMILTLNSAQQPIQAIFQQEVEFDSGCSSQSYHYRDQIVMSCVPILW